MMEEIFAWIHQSEEASVKCEQSLGLCIRPSYKICLRLSAAKYALIHCSFQRLELLVSLDILLKREYKLCMQRL